MRPNLAFIEASGFGDTSCSRDRWPHGFQPCGHCGLGKPQALKKAGLGSRSLPGDRVRPRDRSRARGATIGQGTFRAEAAMSQRRLSGPRAPPSCPGGLGHRRREAVPHVGLAAVPRLGIRWCPGLQRQCRGAALLYRSSGRGPRPRGSSFVLLRLSARPALRAAAALGVAVALTLLVPHFAEHPPRLLGRMARGDLQDGGGWGGRGAASSACTPAGERPRLRRPARRRGPLVCGPSERARVVDVGTGGLFLRNPAVFHGTTSSPACALDARVALDYPGHSSSAPPEYGYGARAEPPRVRRSPGAARPDPRHAGLGGPIGLGLAGRRPGSPPRRPGERGPGPRPRGGSWKFSISPADRSASSCR